jgi:hypothetical protein
MDIMNKKIKKIPKPVLRRQTNQLDDIICFSCVMPKPILTRQTNHPDDVFSFLISKFDIIKREI